MKKVLALVLASAMAIGMATTAFAATTDKITGFASGMTLGHSYKGNITGAALSGDSSVVYGTDIAPTPASSTRIKDYIPLVNDMFVWDAGGTTTNSSGRLTAKQIRTSKLTVRTSVSAGSKAIDEVKIDSSEGRIEVKFAKELVSTGDLDFDFTVYLSINGSRQTDAGLTFTGTMANEITLVYDGDDYVETGYGQIAHAQEYISSIEVDLGNGVSIFTKLFNDKKYYGTSTLDVDSADDGVLSKYPDIDSVITLKTIGLNGSGDIVSMADIDSGYYVYDKDMNYLGMSSQMLPYSTKYYLANKKLDVVDDEVTDDGGAPEATDDGENENPDGGGDDGFENSNANPSTGC